MENNRFDLINKWYQESDISFCFVVTLWDYTILLNQYHCKVQLHTNIRIKVQVIALELHLNAPKWTIMHKKALKCMKNENGKTIPNDVRIWKALCGPVTIWI